MEKSITKIKLRFWNLKNQPRPVARKNVSCFFSLSPDVHISLYRKFRQEFLENFLPYDFIMNFSFLLFN